MNEEIELRLQAATREVIKLMEEREMACVDAIEQIYSKEFSTWGSNTYLFTLDKFDTEIDRRVNEYYSNLGC